MDIAHEPTGKFQFRIVCVALAFLYCAIYIWIYSEISIVWSYIGARFVGIDPFFAAGLCLVTAVLALLIPSPKSHLIPSVFVTLIYLVVFIPSIITPYLQGFSPKVELFKSHIALVLGFLALAKISALSGVSRRLPIKPPRNVALFVILGIWAGLNLYVLYVFRGNISISSPEEVYDKRFAADYIIGGGLVVYAIANLAGSINPFLLALGMAERRVYFIGLAVASNILLFSTVALRAHLVNMIFCVGLFLLFRMKLTNERRIALIMAAPLVLCMLFAPFMPYYGVENSAMDQIISLVVFRTLEMPGILYGCYLDFFSIFPQTYYSHIRPVGLIIPYPYGMLQLGQVVGDYIAPQSGLETLNVNASFLATDGIAAIGLAGVVAISALVGLIIRFIGQLVTAIDPRIVMVALLPVITNLSNSSLFTTALTGGGIISVLILAAWPGSTRVQRDDAG